MSLKEEFKRETEARIALLVAYGHAKKAALLAAFLVGALIGFSLSFLTR